MRALEVIFNASIMSGTFLDIWKYAIVMPIYKRGDVYNIRNYRPIALLSISSKVFEKLIKTQLSEYLLSNKIISNTQHRFHQNWSCQMVPLRLSKILFTLKSAKMCTYVTALDFRCAFNTLNLEILCKIFNNLVSTITAF